MLSGERLVAGCLVGQDSLSMRRSSLALTQKRDSKGREVTKLMRRWVTLVLKGKSLEVSTSSLILLLGLRPPLCLDEAEGSSRLSRGRILLLLLHFPLLLLLFSLSLVVRWREENQEGLLARQGAGGGGPTPLATAP